jgi:hypothetical protein
MPASTSLRWPESFNRGAFTMIWCAASTLVAISASLNAIAWWSAIWLPEAGALLGVLPRQLEGADGDAARAGGHVHAADLDAVHHLVEALARASPPRI